MIVYNKLSKHAISDLNTLAEAIVLCYHARFAFNLMQRKEEAFVEKDFNLFY